MGDFIDFLHYVGKLKRVKRTGWVVQGVKNSESVAEHSYRVSVLAMLLAKKFDLDENKIIKMALIHDLSEGVSGDIVLEKGLKKITPAEEKFKREEKAIKKIFLKLDEGDEYYKLWTDYVNQSSKEAKFLKQIDKIEMVIQALEYEDVQDPKKLNEFWINTEKYLSNPDLITLFKKLKSKRKI